MLQQGFLQPEAEGRSAGSDGNSKQVPTASNLQLQQLRASGTDFRSDSMLEQMSS